MGNKLLERSIQRHHCFAKCNILEQTATIDENEDVDEKFNNLFEELSKELQINGETAADEYSNFGHKFCT